MEVHYSLPSGTITVRVMADDDSYVVTILRDNAQPATYRINLHQADGERLIMGMGDRTLRAHVARDGRDRLVSIGGNSWRLRPPQPDRGQAEPSHGSLEASMPGKVLEVLVREGQEVESGQVLLVLEAMKMELRIVAPAAGRIRKLAVAEGEVVDQGQRLVELG